MNYLELKEKFDKNRTYEIKLGSVVPDTILETYLESGMKLKIKSILIDQDDVVTVTVDYSQFIKNNERFESSEWHMPTGSDKRLGTMKEARMYPNNHIEDIYLMKTDEMIFKPIVTNSIEKARLVYKKSNKYLSFDEWLAKKAGF